MSWIRGAGPARGKKGAKEEWGSRGGTAVTRAEGRQPREEEEAEGEELV